MKPVLKYAPGFLELCGKRLKLSYDELPSSFASKFSLRRCAMVGIDCKEMHFTSYAARSE
jgi:hypothetical protein